MRTITPTINTKNTSSMIADAPITKRIGAFLIDMAMVLVVFLVLIGFVSHPIALAIVPLDEISEQYQDQLEASHLYVYNDDRETMDAITNYYLPANEDGYDEYFDIIETHLVTYYQEFQSEHLATYRQAQLDSELFVLSGDQYVRQTEGVTSNEFVNFYQRQFNIATQYLARNPEVASLSRTLYTAMICELLGSLMVPLLIFYFIIPMCFRYGETLGKKMLKLRVMQKDGQHPIKKWQTILRFVIFAFVEMIGSVITFGLPLLISFVLVTFSSTKRSLHDFGAQSVVVEYKPSLAPEVEIVEEVEEEPTSNKE